MLAVGGGGGEPFDALKQQYDRVIEKHTFKRQMLLAMAADMDTLLPVPVAARPDSGAKGFEYVHLGSS